MRFLALDVGEVRIGFAVCDPLETMAFPSGVLRRKGSLRADVDSVVALAAEREVDAIVVGLPLSLDGQVGPQAQRTQGFARALANKGGLPVVMWDESLSSVEADQAMREQGLSRAKRRAHIDEQAAALILASYLEHRRRTGAPPDKIA